MLWVEEEKLSIIGASLSEPHTNRYYKKKHTTYVCMYVCIRDTSNTCFAHACMCAPPELNQTHVYIYMYMDGRPRRRAALLSNQDAILTAG